MNNIHIILFVLPDLILSCLLCNHQNKPEQRVVKDTITSIFFPTSRMMLPKGVLLKRGPVLLGGLERELMLFNNGFLLSHVELDALKNLMLDISSGRVKKSSNALDKQLSQRFSEIDTDGGGCECT